MQLEQILGAAVAAVNGETDLDQLPSPDVPLKSPSVPSSADYKTDTLHDCNITDKSIYVNADNEISAKDNVTYKVDTDHVDNNNSIIKTSSTNFNAEIFRTSKIVPKRKIRTKKHKKSLSPSSRLLRFHKRQHQSIIHEFHEEMSDCNSNKTNFFQTNSKSPIRCHASDDDKEIDNESVSDTMEISFFNLDENLVITSQQALQMFETPTDEPLSTAILNIQTHEEQIEEGEEREYEEAKTKCRQIKSTNYPQKISKEVQVYNEPQDVPYLDEGSSDVPAAYAEVEVFTTSVSVEVPEFSIETTTIAEEFEISETEPECIIKNVNDDTCFHVAENIEISEIQTDSITINSNNDTCFDNIEHSEINEVPIDYKLKDIENKPPGEDHLTMVNDNDINNINLTDAPPPNIDASESTLLLSSSSIENTVKSLEHLNASFQFLSSDIPESPHCTVLPFPTLESVLEETEFTVDDFSDEPTNNNLEYTVLSNFSLEENLHNSPCNLFSESGNKIQAVPAEYNLLDSTSCDDFLDLPDYDEIMSSSNTEDLTAAAVSEALQTLASNGVIDPSTDGTLEATSLDTTLNTDTNEQFCVQVMAPGMNMSISNQYVAPNSQATTSSSLMDDLHQNVLPTSFPSTQDKGRSSTTPSPGSSYSPPQTSKRERHQEDLGACPSRRSRDIGSQRPSLSALKKEVSWMTEADGSTSPSSPQTFNGTINNHNNNHNNNFNNESYNNHSSSGHDNTYRCSTNANNNNRNNTRKGNSNDYNKKQIIDWSFFEVAHFLIEACRDLDVEYDQVNFADMSNKRGVTLLEMTPDDFDKFAPNHGTRVYEHFIKYKNHRRMIDETPGEEHFSYNDHHSPSDGSHYGPTVRNHSPLHIYHQHHNIHHHQISTNNLHNSQPLHLFQPITNSPEPSSDYIPQGYQFSDHYLSSSTTPTSLLDNQRIMGRIDNQRDHYKDVYGTGSHMYDADDINTGIMETYPSQHDAQTNVYTPNSNNFQKELTIEKKPSLQDPPKKRGPGRPPKPENERKRKEKKTGRLWEFIRNLLLDHKTCPSLVRWECPKEGIFRFIHSEKVATMWGMRKNNRKMNYEKLSRAMRYYYKGRIFEPVLGRRLVYKFGPRAKGWQPSDPNFAALIAATKSESHSNDVS